MKKIILTIDYEIYFGRETGSVEDCMIDPTNKLMDILDLNDSKMTVFWDILHFHKLLEMEEKHPELKSDRIAIQNQIFDLHKRGHDIQLHIHSHWLDSTFIDGKWVFTYDRFKVHNLTKGDRVEDINSVLGCVTYAKNLMERIVRQVDEHYKVTTFRAGGYLIEPFQELCTAFIQNNITVDSSVCPDMINNNDIFSYNFKNYPKELIYRFSNDISRINNKGRFIEITVTTIRIPLLTKIYFTLLKRYKYKNFRSELKGTGSGEHKIINVKGYDKIRKYILENNFHQLTTDDTFREKYNYLLSRTRDYSTQILHQKILNQHTISLLRSKLSKYDIKFISIKNFLEIRLI